MNDHDRKPDPGWLRPLVRRLPGFVTLRTLQRTASTRYQVRRQYRVEAPPPRVLMIETSARCNLRCEKCGYRASHRPRGIMDFHLAIEALDQAKDFGVKLVGLSQLGEPLLNPDLERIIDAARSRGLTTHFVTNGVLLKPERARSLIEAGVNKVVVSFDGWDRASHAARQGGADQERVLANLRAFNEIRAGNRPPWLSAVTVIDTGSVHHFPEIKNLLAPLVDRIEPIPLTDYGAPGCRIDHSLLLGERSFHRLPCQMLWSYLSVGWDGRVGGCCNDHEFALANGRIQERPLKELWNSHTMREWRRLHLTGRFDQMPRCGQCTIDYGNSHRFQVLRYRLLNG